MIKIQSQDFDIQKIADSGQCFRLTAETPGQYVLRAQGHVLRIGSLPDGARLFCTKAEYRAFWKNYFDMDNDYHHFRAAIPPSDGYLTAAAAYGRGIRILRQDPWETLVTFLISQRKNIPAIRRAVETLCYRYGNPLPGGDGFDFPTPDRLAALSEVELRACSLGYRANYLLEAARMVQTGKLKRKELAGKDDASLLTSLQNVPGVGPKVAGCVALFGFHRLTGFPRDVWINRIIDLEYGGTFPLAQYAGFEGVIQQYLFFYARTQARRT